MTVTLLPQQIEKNIREGFSAKYVNFAPFMADPQHEALRQLCIKAASNIELLEHIIFCNDLFCIPPVKTFLEYYKQEMKTITDDEQAILNDFQKRAIGAFWGYVFKSILGYEKSKNVTVSLNKMFHVSTASYFFNE